MQNYQFFYADATGEVTRTWDFICPEDAAAMELAKKLMKNSATAEVWCGARFMAELVAGSALERFRLLWNQESDETA
jgi:quinolinate synthase